MVKDLKKNLVRYTMLLTCYSNTVVMSAFIGWFKKPPKKSATDVLIVMFIFLNYIFGKIYKIEIINRKG